MKKGYAQHEVYRIVVKGHLFLQSKRLSNARQERGAVVNGSQQNKGNTIRELVLHVSSDLDSQVRLANPTWPGEGDEAHLLR